MALPQINQEQYRQLLDIVMTTNHPMLVVGEPGIGKTRTPLHYCAEHDIDLIIEHPATAGPQDIKGLPSKSTMKVATPASLSDDLNDLLDDLGTTEEYYEVMDIATFLPFGNMLKVLTATKPTLLFFDDFGMAPASVQASLMQVIGDRNLCGKAIPDCVKIIGCTNDKTHKANVSGILEPVKSRFGLIVELVADLPGFRKYSADHKFYPGIGIFLESQPQALSEFRTDKGMEQSPNPRLWEKLSDELYAAEKLFGADDKLRDVICSAAIGSAWGKQYAAFEKLRHKIDSYDTILADPENYPINQPMDIRFFMLGMLATQGKPEHHERIFQYTNKMAKEYQVAFFRMLKTHNPDIMNSDSGQRWWADNMDVYLD